MIDTPLLITSVLVTSAIKSNSLKSYDERLNQTIEAINKILDFKIFKKIVIVDGSNSKIFTDNEIKYFLELGVEIEQIVFQQNTDYVKKYGKSYGEVEIVNFSVLNSNLINRSKEFYKISGRYSIENLDKLVKTINKYENVFFYDNPPFLNKGREFVSTIFYKVSVDFYFKYLRDAQVECNYTVYGYLESVYYRCLKNIKRDRIPVQFPLYDAISGTTGNKSKTRFLIIRKIVSKIGFLCYHYPNNSY